MRCAQIALMVFSTSSAESSALRSVVAFNAKSFIDNMPCSLPSSGLIIGNRRTCFCCMILSASRTSVSVEQPYTWPEITSFARISAGSRCLVAPAMQISRSVIIPTVICC